MKVSHVIILLSILLSFTTCVEIIEFESSTVEKNLVVDGGINTSWGPHQIQLSTSNDFGIRSIQGVGGAEILLFENEEEVAIFRETENGLYQIPVNNVQGKVGSSYHIAITLADGKQYLSEPDVLPSVFPIDSVTSNFATEQYQNRFGNVINGSFVNVRAHTTIPDGMEQASYARWDLETIWTLLEIQCAPLHIPKNCYMPKDLITNDIHLLSTKNKIPNSPHEEWLARELLTKEYNYQHSYRVFQTSLSEPAYQYWEKVDQVVNQVGGIFDAPPASLQGNVFNTNESSERVLGYFEAVAVDTALSFVVKATLDGLNRPIVRYCSNAFRFDRPDECCQCLLLENSSIVKPDFW